MTRDRAKIITIVQDSRHFSLKLCLPQPVDIAVFVYS